MTHRCAYAALQGMVLRQAAMVSFVTISGCSAVF